MPFFSSHSLKVSHHEDLRCWLFVIPSWLSGLTSESKFINQIISFFYFSSLCCCCCFFHLKLNEVVEYLHLLFCGLVFNTGAFNGFEILLKLAFFAGFLEPGLKDRRMTWVRFNVSYFPFFQWSPPLLLSIKMLPAMLMRQESCTLRVRANSVTQWFERYRDIWVKSSNSGWVSISPLIKENQFLSYIFRSRTLP